mmetsp:Transcript_10535/g.17209  ORF Transcript_10535/g.17209 Transcript_10535/m.17209 type:complete len:114 (+) Transcript_10535:45-386(+)
MSSHFPMHATFVMNTGAVEVDDEETQTRIAGVMQYLPEVTETEAAERVNVSPSRVSGNAKARLDVLRERIRISEAGKKEDMISRPSVPGEAKAKLDALRERIRLRSESNSSTE